MKKIILSSFIIFVLVFSLGFSNVFAKPSQAENDFIDVLISFENIPGPAERGLIKRAGGDIKYSYNLVPGIAAKIPSSALEGLKRNPKIKLIESDGMFWAIDYKKELENSWGVKHIQSGEVHKEGGFGEDVKVAVIDTGIDYDHPEIDHAYMGGYNFFNNNDNPMDDNGHGTHVAGIIAANRDGAGVVGVSPGVELYGLKVLGSDGGGNFSDVIAALDWAVENDIKITNNSYGSGSDPGELVKQAFDNSHDSGILHIAAAGNSGNPPGRGDSIGYPAKWDSVVAVAAVDKNNKRPNWSSTGPNMEFSAPGVSINSTWLNGGYRTISGTSMASPHVAGTAALVMGSGDYSMNEVREILRNTAENIGAFNHYGYGLINAFSAFSEGSFLDPDPEPDPEPEPDPDPEPDPEPEKCPPGWARQGRC